MIHLGSTDFFAALPNVIEHPDDDEDVIPRPRRSKKAAAGKVSQSELATEPTVQQPEDAGRASIIFVVPVSSERLAPSTVPVSPSVVPSHASKVQAAAPGSSALFFTSYPVSENQSAAAAKAIRQANVMMERMKTVHENSQAAYDASAALRANVQVSRLPTDLVLVGFHSNFKKISYAHARSCDA